MAHQTLFWRWVVLVGRGIIEGGGVSIVPGWFLGQCRLFRRRWLGALRMARTGLCRRSSGRIRCNRMLGLAFRERDRFGDTGASHDGSAGLHCNMSMTLIIYSRHRRSDGPWSIDGAIFAARLDAHGIGLPASDDLSWKRIYHCVVAISRRCHTASGGRVQARARIRCSIIIRVFRPSGHKEM